MKHKKGELVKIIGCRDSSAPTSTLNLEGIIYGVDMNGYTVNFGKEICGYKIWYFVEKDVDLVLGKIYKIFN